MSNRKKSSKRKPSAVEQIMLGIERSSLPGNVDELRVELVAIVAQLESCDYACEGGRLGNNVAFVRLKEIAAGAA